MPAMSSVRPVVISIGSLVFAGWIATRSAQDQGMASLDPVMPAAITLVAMDAAPLCAAAVISDAEGPLPAGAVRRIDDPRWRHDDCAVAIAWLPDGTLLSGGNDHTLRAWDATGVETWRLELPRLNVHTIDPILGGSAVLVCGSDMQDQAIVVDLRERKAVRSIRLYSVMDDQAVSREGDRVVVDGEHSTSEVWDLENGQLVASWAEPAIQRTFLPTRLDGVRPLAVANNPLQVVDAGSGAELAQGPQHDYFPSEHDNFCEAVASSTDGRLAEAGTGYAAEDDPVTLAPRHLVTTNPRQTFMQVAIQPGAGGAVVLGDFAGGLWRWDGGPRLALIEQGDRHQYVCAMRFSPDGGTLAVTRQGELRPHFFATATWQRIHAPNGPSTYVGHLAFAPDGRRIAIASAGIEIWDVQEGRRLAALGASDHGAGVAGLAWRDDGHLVSTGFNDRLNVWNLADGSHRGFDLGFTAHQVRCDGDAVLAIGSHNVAGLSLADGTCRWSVAAPDDDHQSEGKDWLRGATASPLGVLMNEGGFVRIADPRSGATRGRIEAPAGRYDYGDCVGVNAAGQVVMAVRLALLVIDPATQRVVARADPDVLGSGAMAMLSPDGRRILVSGSGEAGGLLILDAGSLRPLVRTKLAGIQPSAYAFSPDGASLVVGTESGQLLVFDLARVMQGAAP
jgi:WD40 repeat protein